MNLITTTISAIIITTSAIAEEQEKFQCESLTNRIELVEITIGGDKKNKKITSVKLNGNSGSNIKQTQQSVYFRAKKDGTPELWKLDKEMELRNNYGELYKCYDAFIG